MDKYYNIAGFLIRITGEESETINRIDGFDFFKTKAGKPYFTLRLVHEVNKEVLTENESILLYVLEHENITSRFIRLADYSYCLSTVSTESSEPLFLHYSPGSRECFLTGLMNPDLIRFALWTTFGILTAGQAISIHASAIIYESKAIIFLSESDTEKNTHACLWKEYIPGAVLFNDDSPIIRMDSSLPYICSSPWSSKTSDFHNERFPLAGIIRLSQAPCNQINRLWMLEAIDAMLPSCPPIFAKDGELSRLIYDTLSEMLSHVPSWHLRCIPNKEAVKLLYETMFTQ